MRAMAPGSPRPQHGPGRGGDLERDAALLEAALELGADRAGELAELDGLRAHLDLRVEPAEVQQLGGQALQARGLRAGAGDLLAGPPRRRSRRPRGRRAAAPATTRATSAACAARATRSRRRRAGPAPGGAARPASSVSARPRSPTSSLTVSVGGGGAAGPSRVIRSAAWRRRRSRRTRVVASPRREDGRHPEPDEGGGQEGPPDLGDRRRDVGEALLGGQQADLVVALEQRRDDQGAVAVLEADRGAAGRRVDERGEQRGRRQRRAAAERVDHGPARRATVRRGRVEAKDDDAAVDAVGQVEGRELERRAVGVAALQQAPVLGLARRSARAGAARPSSPTTASCPRARRRPACAAGPAATAAAPARPRAASRRRGEHRRQEPRAQPEAAAPHGSRKR